MIFLPNNFDRMTAALRNTVQNLISKNGIKPKYLRMNMLIYKAEAFLSIDEMPTELDSFFSQILGLISVKKTIQKKTFDFYVGDIGRYIINRKSYISLILLLSQKSEFIKIKNKNGEILILVKGCKFFNCKREIIKLKGLFLKDIKNDILIIKLTPSKSDKRSVKNIKDWLDITNPLSMINCYLYD